MNYSQTLDYLYSQLPMFHRIGAAAYKADLNNTIAICKLLGNPHNKFKSIHIAGTNGKGSVSHSLAAILQTAGYKTGLYTSPHLKDFRERIRINGKMIPEKKVIAGQDAGHGCGHNLFGTASVAAAISLKQLMASGQIKGTLRVYGCPAEEGGSGKVYLVQIGRAHV